MNDVKKALAEGRVRILILTSSCSPLSLSPYQMKEMFGAGTACIVCPISEILYLNEVRKQLLYIHVPYNDDCSF